jgi:hypothetical protein
MAQEGDIEPAGVVVFRMKASCQPKGVLQVFLRRRCVASVDGVLLHQRTVIVEQVPTGQPLTKMQALQPFSGDGHRFHPRADTQNFSDDRLVFHRVK